MKGIIISVEWFVTYLITVIMSALLGTVIFKCGDYPMNFWHLWAVLLLPVSVCGLFWELLVQIARLCRKWYDKRN